MLRPKEDTVDEQQKDITAEDTAALSKALEVGGTLEVEASKPAPLDPYVLFLQIDGLRKEGVSEDVIREAFNQFMSERAAPRKKVQNSMKRHPDSLPMPTQEEINKMYTKSFEDRVVSPELETLISEVENAKNRRLASEKPSFRKFKNAMARKFMVLILRVTIFVFKSLGVR